MGDFIEGIINYLLVERKTAFDVILLGVAVYLIGLLMNVLLKQIKRLLQYLFNVSFNKAKEFFRLYINQKINLNEYIQIQERIENGGNLKWFEKKSYYAFKAKEESLQKHNKKQIKGYFPNTNEFIKEMTNWDIYKK